MYFVIRRNTQGKYWWRAVGNNNKILAASELMETKEACKNGIGVVQRGAATAPIYDKTDVVKNRRQV